MSTKLGHCIRSESNIFDDHVDAAAVANIFDEPAATLLMPFTVDGIRLITLMIIIAYKIECQLQDSLNEMTFIGGHFTNNECVHFDGVDNDDRLVVVVVFVVCIFCVEFRFCFGCAAVVTTTVIGSSGRF